MLVYQRVYTLFSEKPRGLGIEILYIEIAVNYDFFVVRTIINHK
jgi:hypothetical protein